MENLKENVMFGDFRPSYIRTPSEIETLLHEEIPHNRSIYDHGTQFLFSFPVMSRACRKKASISASGAELCARTTTKRRRKTKDEKLTKMGGTVCSQEDPPTLESPTSLQVKGFTLPLTEEPDYSKVCPKCSSCLKPAAVPEGFTSSLVQCLLCPTTPLCGKCLFPCPDATCTNQSCQAVSLLLTCDRVTRSSSRVYGCPVFRACPKCSNIMMHQVGCKYVTCAQCSHTYCFICLRTRQECVKDINLYFSLTCSAPTATRQRFQT